MFRRVIQNPALQQFGKKVLTDVAQSAAEDMFSSATGVQPGRTGPPSLGEALYAAGKGTAQLYLQDSHVQQQLQAPNQYHLRQQMTIALAQDNARKRLEAQGLPVGSLGAGILGRWR